MPLMTQNNGNYSQASGEIINAIYEMSKGSSMLLLEKLVCIPGYLNPLLVPGAGICVKSNFIDTLS
jgi:hypothetical protein